MLSSCLSLVGSEHLYAHHHNWPFVVKYVIQFSTFSFVWNIFNCDIKRHWQYWRKINTVNFTIFLVFHLLIQNCVNCMKFSSPASRREQFLGSTNQTTPTNRTSTQRLLPTTGLSSSRLTLTRLPWYLCYRVILSPCYLVTLLPCYLDTLLPCYLVTLLPCYLVTLLPCCLVALLPCHLVTLYLIPWQGHLATTHNGLNNN